MLMLMLPPAIADAADMDKSGHGDELSERNKSHYYAALGPALTPDYEGSDYYEVLPLVIARWIKRGRYAELVGAKLRANLIAESLWQFGPVLRWNRARGNVESGPVDRMEHIDGALEAGGFFGALLRDPDAPRRRLGLEVEALQDVWGVHDGYVLNLDLSGGTPLNDNWAVDVSITSTWASNAYMSTYFGVNASDAVRSGLQPFRASSGFKDVAFSANISYSLSDHWGVAMSGRYQRLLGDAADSPVVASAGSPNQYVLTFMATCQY